MFNETPLHICITIYKPPKKPLGLRVEKEESYLREESYKNNTNIGDISRGLNALAKA